jgi:hypothetical protein
VADFQLHYLQQNVGQEIMPWQVAYGRRRYKIMFQVLLYIYSYACEDEIPSNNI